MIAGTSQSATSPSPSASALPRRASATRQPSPDQSGARTAVGTRSTRITGPFAKAPNASAAPSSIQAPGRCVATSARIPRIVASVSMASNIVSPA